MAPLYKYVGYSRGGEAILYFATDNNGQEIAIRVLKESFEDGFAAKRVIRELLFIKHCNHQNVIKLLNQFVVTDLNRDMVAIVMPKMKYALDRFRDIPPPEEKDVKDHRFGSLQNIMHDTLSGIEYLHSRGIIHRDLSMGNIMFDIYSNATIIDFGLSQAPSPNTDLTEGQATEAYRAPELYTKNYDKKVDLWSIGTIFIELATGRPFYDPPFNTGNPFIDHLLNLLPFYSQDDAFMETFICHSATKKYNIEQIKATGPTTLREKYPSDIWLPDYEYNTKVNPISAKYEDAMVLFEQLLQFRPDKRPTASEALDFAFFKHFKHTAPSPSQKISELAECRDVLKELDAIGNRELGNKELTDAYIKLLKEVVADTEKVPLESLISLPTKAARWYNMF